MVSIADIRDARAAIADRIHRTPTFGSRALGARTGTRLVLKAESLQKTGSFKVRGTLNRLRTLDAGDRRRGLVTVSAGNHAQALAYAARTEGIPCTVVMPAAASPAKVAASRGYGAQVELHGSVFDAFERAQTLARERGYVLVHPFDEPAIIAGQGTAALELLEDAPDLDAVIVPVGGGGLISGIAAAVKALSPRTRVYGVEPAGAAAVRAGLDAGRPVFLDAIDTIADGLSAPTTGACALEHVRALVDDVVLVDDAVIAEALRLILERAKLVIEPAAAAGLAALLDGRIPLAADARVACVLSGGNIDLARLRALLPSTPDPGTP